MERFGYIALTALAALSHSVLQAEESHAAASPFTTLRSLDSKALTQELRERAAQMLRDQVRLRVRSVNQLDREAWSRIQTKTDWERWVGPRVDLLRASLGVFPPPPSDLHGRVTRTLEGDGYQVENLVFESRPGLFVAANLYVPSPRRAQMPGIVIVHSHHNPKPQGELQDMGMTWARQGCLVLVIDQLSYGERRQHAAGNRQDYRFRYINGIQLQIIGDSLMGWMVWDIMRGVDLLLLREGIDQNKIILIGSVAGGGDPVAVAAALDSRITCAVPFNFGGPQPETTYPLPEDAEKSFNYLGGGSWESTRNLRRSGADGFLPWTIVASVAPRRLIYAHEFSWDRERDPVWKRLQTVFAFYSASNNLAFTHGGGVLQGQPPDATHCNNVGAVHRKLMHSAFERWFGIPAPQEYQSRRAPEDLICLTPEFKTRPLHELYTEIGVARADAFRAQLQQHTREQQRRLLREQWAKLLGQIEPRTPKVLSRTSERVALNQPASSRPLQIHFERVVLESEPGILVPLVLARAEAPKRKPPIVVAVSQQGKARFLAERAETIAELLRNGAAVCLPDVRGAGETAAGASRQYRSEATSISATELMLGRTMLGLRLQDLRAVFRYLRTRDDLNSRRLALWGDSFAPTNPKGFSDPLIDEGDAPLQSEPLGGLLALFGALYESDVRAVVAEGTLAGFQSVLRDRFCYVPHDAIVPGALTAGDLSDVAAALAPRPLRLARLVDGRNVSMNRDEVESAFATTLKAYGRAKNKYLFLPPSDGGLGSWLIRALAGSL